jgi:hypothetical protein
MLDKHFYVIYRDGQIIEIKKTEESFNAVLAAMQNKGIVVLKEYGIIANGVDISKVLNEEQYENYISSAKPKEYIKNGAWRDGKEHQVIRYEKWRQLEIEKIEKLEAPNTEPKEIPNGQIWSHRENKMLSVKEVFEKYRPQFLREIDQKNLTK